MTKRRRDATSRAGTTKHSVAVGVLALALVAGGLGATAGIGTARPTVDPGTPAWLETWSLDANANRVDDRLDTLLETNPERTVYLHVHYAEHPTQTDARQLRLEHGAERTYVFRNFDMIKVQAQAEDVPGILDAPGVVAVEEFVPPTIENDVATKVMRVEAAPDVGLADGLDHAKAVHETLGYRGEGMVIAVLDTGVDNRHESLDDLDDDPNTYDPKRVERADPVTGDVIPAAADASNGFEVLGCVDPQDDDGHGTHVAGSALGTGGPSGQYAGVAPQARLVEVDIAVPAGATAVGIGQDIGYDWIISYNAGETCYGDPGDETIDVATVSFGTGGDAPDASANRGITEAVRSGITFTVSAGNSGPGARTLSSGAEGAIIVAASDDHGTVSRANDELADFSSRGPREADGDQDDLDELRPDIAAPGVSIRSAWFHTNRYVSFDGTSMATPLVAGVATLMLQANPALTPINTNSNAGMGAEGTVPVRDIIQQTAQYKTAAQEADPQHELTGKFGLPWNNAWGYGLIDAYAAVQAAVDAEVQPPPVGDPIEITLTAELTDADGFEDGRYIYTSTGHTFERLDGIAHVEDADGNPLEGATVDGTVVYVPVTGFPLALVVDRFSEQTDEAGETNFGWEQDLNALLDRGESLASLPGHHEIRLTATQPGTALDPGTDTATILYEVVLEA